MFSSSNVTEEGDHYTLKLDNPFRAHSFEILNVNVMNNFENIVDYSINYTTGGNTYTLGLVNGLYSYIDLVTYLSSVI